MSKRGKLTHLDARGRARMVDVGAKAETARTAVAKGRIRMRPQTLHLMRQNALQKGDVLSVAQIAGIAAAKRTAELIPLAHPLPLTNVQIDFELIDAAPQGDATVEITATASATAKTGVEMEALTAVTVAALTIYDMCKAVDRAMRIQEVRLVRKTGGRSGEITLE